MFWNSIDRRSSEIGPPARSNGWDAEVTYVNGEEKVKLLQMRAFVCRVEKPYFDNGLGRIGNGEEIKKHSLGVDRTRKSRFGLTGGKGSKESGSRWFLVWLCLSLSHSLALLLRSRV